MASEREQLRTALGVIDDGLAPLAGGLTSFQDASQTVSRAVYQAHGHGEQFALEQTIGTARLLDLIVRRMRTLGLGAVLDQARTQGTLDDTVSAMLAPKIERLLG